MVNYYHLAIATALPTEYDSNWEKSSSPNPNLRGGWVTAQARETLHSSMKRLWSRGWGWGGTSGSMAPSALVPTQHQGSSKQTSPSSSTSLDRSRWVGKVWVMDREASRLTCSQVSTMCFPPSQGEVTPYRITQLGDALGYSAPLPSDSRESGCPCRTSGGCGAVRGAWPGIGVPRRCGGYRPYRERAAGWLHPCSPQILR